MLFVFIKKSNIKRLPLRFVHLNVTNSLFLFAVNTLSKYC